MTTSVTAGEFRLVYDPSVGSADTWYINDHTFIRDRTGTWHLIGITHTEPAAPADELHLAHATAPRLLGPWTKQAFALSTSATDGETHLWAPHVIEHGDRYWMYVCAGGASFSEYRIHLATSDDCTNWRRHRANPLVVDGFQARDPMVVRLGDDHWAMYYTANSERSGGHHVVIATESSDLEHWRGRRVVYRDEISGTYGGPTESPFVLPHGGRYYLFIGPDWARQLESIRRDPSAWSGPGYRGTRVLASDDPFHFDLDGQVGFVDAHAAEVITDDDGSLWISHCGWGQGGVYLAPLTLG